MVYPPEDRSPIPVLTGLNVEQLRTTNDATTALNEDQQVHVAGCAPGRSLPSTIASSRCCEQTPLVDQEGPKVGTSSFFEVLSSREIAYHMTCYDWELFNCVHEVSKLVKSLLEQTTCDVALASPFFVSRAS